MCDVNLQNNAGYTPVMLAALTAPDGPGGMEVVRKLMELGNIHTRSKQVEPGDHPNNSHPAPTRVPPHRPSDRSDSSALGGETRSSGDGAPAAELRGRC